MAEYFTRLSPAMSQGEQVNRVLVIEPTTTAWMYQGDAPDGTAEGDRRPFFDLLMSLEQAQVEYDIGCEDIIAGTGTASAEGPASRVSWSSASAAYDTVVLPPLTENLNAKTMDLLEPSLQAGGAVLCCGDAARAGRRPALGPRREAGQAAAAGSRSRPDAWPQRCVRAWRAGLRPSTAPPATRASCSITAAGWTTANCCCWSTRASTRPSRGHRSSRSRKGVEAVGLPHRARSRRIPFADEGGRDPARLRAAALRQPAAVPVQASRASRRPTADRKVDDDRSPTRRARRSRRVGAERADARLRRRHGRRRDEEGRLLLPGQPVRLSEERHGAQPVGQRRAVQGRADHARSSRRTAASRPRIASRSRGRCPSRWRSSSSGPTCTRSPATASRSRRRRAPGGSTRPSAGSTSPRPPRWARTP